ncbi:MAG: EAL domain-containing protein, partial [Gammaproteobacteria bacterium]|nr:EAL domain-containing protein [Gammaproteobacteria bacterium]
ERVNHVLIRAKRQPHLVALLYLDLDGFKHINDSFGHEVGDRVLALTAERLKSCVRAEDMLARLGGDEFAVLLEEVSEPWSAALVAEKIIEALRTPFPVDEQELVLGVSIGVSIFPTDGADASVLLRNADTAMYRAKARGGSVVHFYTPTLTEVVRQRVSIESDLRRAINDNELELYFQPIMAIDSQRIVGAEALLRWRALGRGVLLPENFLPIAEMSGLIIQIGGHMIELACHQLAEWRKRALVVPRLSVNISARQCMDEDFPAGLKQVLDKYSLPVESIDVEITESCFFDKGAAGKILLALKQAGVSLTIDDFGTGYSTLSALRQVPVNAIKIDRAFVDEISGGKDGGAIARAVIALGKSQNLRVVAEGVETQQQLEALKKMGCDACQGYLVAPAMEAPAFLRWLEERRNRIDAA